MDLRDMTVLILTRDEAVNIGRTLAALSWAPSVIVVDSFSTDDTAAIVARFPNARLVTHAFSGHGAQWQFAVTQLPPSCKWILALDADYRVSDELAREIASLTPPTDVSAYRARFSYAVGGRPIRSGVYRPPPILLRRGACDFYQYGHAHRVRVVAGKTASLAGHVVHDDRKDLGRWLASQARYATLEAEKLARLPDAELGPSDRLRKRTCLAPLLVGFYVLLVRGAWRDGRAGWVYALQRVTYELILLMAKWLRVVETEERFP